MYKDIICDNNSIEEWSHIGTKIFYIIEHKTFMLWRKMFMFWYYTKLGCNLLNSLLSSPEKPLKD